METTIGSQETILNGINMVSDNFLSKGNFEDAFSAISFKLKHASTDEDTQLPFQKASRPSQGFEGSLNDRENSKMLNVMFESKIKAFIPRRTTPTTFHFKQTQNWIGYITELHEDCFDARLEEVNKSGTFEVATFDLEEVSDADKNLIALGSIFYWSVGYAVRSGQVIKESFIRFQRLPPWNEDELDRVVDKSSSLRANLNWE